MHVCLTDLGLCPVVLSVEIYIHKAHFLTLSIDLRVDSWDVHSSLNSSVNLIFAGSLYFCVIPTYLWREIQPLFI